MSGLLHGNGVRASIAVDRSAMGIIDETSSIRMKPIREGKKKSAEDVSSADKVWMDLMAVEDSPVQKADPTCCLSLNTTLNGFKSNVIILCFILVDATLFALRTLSVKAVADSSFLTHVSELLLFIFLAEQLLRLVSDFCKFIKSLFEIVDFILVIASMLIILDQWFGNIIIPHRVANYINDLVLLIIQCSRIGVRLISRGRMFCPAARQLVGGNKQRYQKDGFDLDLTFITKRIIAMGLPSTSIEGMYRNPIDEVVRFFEKNYADHYMLINLCSERTYPASKFKNRVVRFPFDDHNPPPMAIMLRFCMFVDAFLKENPSNVVAIHCKGGKGRTGTMICAWLLYSRCDLYTEQVLKLFAHQRTDQEIGGSVQGVAGPSQIRYINYFEKLRLEGIQEGELDILNVDALEEDKRAPIISVDACKLKLEQAPRCELVSLRMNHVVTKTKYQFTDQKHRDDYGKTWNAAGNWSLIITHYPSGKPLEHEHEFEQDEGGDKYEYTLPHDYFYKASSENKDTDDATSVFIDIKSWQKQSKSVILSGDMKFQVYRRSTTSSNTTTKQSTSGYKTDEQVGSSTLFASFWLHTAFMTPNGAHLILQKNKIDEVCKNEALDEEFNIDLEYILPPLEDSSPVSPGKSTTQDHVQTSTRKKHNKSNKNSLRKKDVIKIDMPPPLDTRKNADIDEIGFDLFE